jgi:hypothetical protein
MESSDYFHPVAAEAEKGAPNKHLNASETSEIATGASASNPENVTTVNIEMGASVNTEKSKRRCVPPPPSSPPVLATIDLSSIPALPKKKNFRPVPLPRRREQIGDLRTSGCKMPASNAGE